MRVMSWSEAGEEKGLSDIFCKISKIRRAAVADQSVGSAMANRSAVVGIS